MTDGTAVARLLHCCAGAIRDRVAAVEDWGRPGDRPGQYQVDLVADEAAVEVLGRDGVVIISEESGRHAGDGLVVVVDPIDASGNAIRSLPPYGPSLCAVDDDGPLAAVVVDLASGTCFEAQRGGGARRDGTPIRGSGCAGIETALVAVSGRPPLQLPTGQMRSLGAAAFELCGVASGVFDAFLDCDDDVHGPWDYLAGVLICTEAGVSVVDAHGRDLAECDPAARRTPVAAATPALLDDLLRLRTADPVRHTPGSAGDGAPAAVAGQRTNRGGRFSRSAATPSA